ncbi:hypothetical protein AAFF_G00324490 [Aldrovandia affinis]|uniref:Helitron helicase-like domain-containing protein n=1 Tax=Aldrovandia affinis TaxID=143900 RepID=A0AAD7R901_9TELE|nr:hypothetical protein AAFF_G00324490 [Aldrovandia affinis]
MRWPEFIEVIKAQQGEEGDFSGLDWNEKCEILRSNPVTVMRMFEKRVDALMTDLILSPAQPISPVEDYLFRVEFQARGSPHIHMVVWIEYALEVEDPEDCPDVIEFIDRFITCQMPDEKTDRELHKIVMQEWICHTCDGHLIKGGMPSIAVANSLELAPVPPELDELNGSDRVQ